MDALRRVVREKTRFERCRSEAVKEQMNLKEIVTTDFHI